MRRSLLYFTAVLPYFAAVLIQDIAVNTIAFFYNLCAALWFNRESLADGLQGEESLMSPELIYLISILGVAVCGIVFFFWYRRIIRDDNRGSIKAVFSTRYIVLLIMLGIGCQLLFSGLLSLLEPLFPKVFAEYSQVIQNITSGNGIIVLILMTIVAPFTEELIFRGVIFQRANSYMAYLGANILQAVLFGLYHNNLIQGLYAAPLGFLLGMICYKFKSIIAPMFLHMIINISSLLLLLAPDNLFSYVLMLIAGGVIGGLALYLIKPNDRIVQDEAS